jgi:hypothetical protein
VSTRKIAEVVRGASIACGSMGTRRAGEDMIMTVADAMSAGRLSDGISPSFLTGPTNLGFGPSRNETD